MKRRRKTSLGAIRLDIVHETPAQLLKSARKAKSVACKRALERAAVVLIYGDQPGASVKMIRSGERLLDKAIRTCHKHGDDA